MVPVSFLYDDMCQNNNECRVFFVHDCTGISTEINDTYFEFRDILNHYEPLYESNRNLIFETFCLFVKMFAKSNYDVSKIKMEPQRINLTFEIPILLRTYKTSHKEEAEIKQHVHNLLKFSLIKESFSPCSVPLVI